MYLAAMALFVVAGRVTADDASVPCKKAKNVIIMISDGAGYNTHLSTTYWQGKNEPYDNAHFVKLPVATYNLRNGHPTDPLHSPPGRDTQDPRVVYDPARAWDETRLPPEVDADSDGYPDYFRGYQWFQSTDPDSAGTMSAIVTGKKVYRGAINVDGYGNPLRTVPEAAKAAGKSTGSISSVRYNHATPAAGGGAHNISRNNYIDISYEMFGAGVLDVMGGPGHPWYEADGTKREKPKLTSNRFDAPLWKAISTGRGIATHKTVDGRTFSVNGADWKMIDDTADIQALAAGTATVPRGKKLMMLPRVWGTLQEERDVTHDWDGDGTINDQQPNTGINLDLRAAHVNPGDNSAGDPWIEGLPTLVDMTKAAINYLDDNPRGIYLQIEGGAVDWAMHANSMGRMIEEEIAFDEAVKAVMVYLDANTNGNNWDNTLLIVTADHDHNLFGPKSDVIAFQDVTDEGPGHNPGHLWHDNSHSNELVPAWIRGVNASVFAKLVDGKDPVRGPYIDEVDLGQVMMKSVDAAKPGE